MTGRKMARTIEKPIRVDELRPWSELPTELLELIVSCLCIEDNIRFSCVCKTWKYVSYSFRVVNQSPWLLYSASIDGIIKFLDPSQRKIYFDETPELQNSIIHCSKDEWVLFTLRNEDAICLYNPFTKSRVDLPYYNIYPISAVRVALSCAPTSPDCVVFAIRNNEKLGSKGVSIAIFHPGDLQWTTFEYCTFFICGNGPVFCNGLFYCLSEVSNNLIGIFDPQKHSWSILPVPPPNLPHLSYDEQRVKHIVECNTELLLVCVSYPEKPIIFKLDSFEMKWVEMQSLNGVTVFVSSHSSVSATDIPRISRNSVYFSKPCCYGKTSYLYSLDDCEYHPANQCHEVKLVPRAVWIKPPKMSHLLFEELY